MRNAIIGGVLLALAAVGGALYVKSPSVAFREQRALIADKLRDPSSTQFRNEHLTNAGWLCGELNSKNGSGGYNGFKRFFVGSQNDVWLEGEGSLNQATTSELVELLEEKIAVNKTYIELRKAAPNVEVPSEYYREEQAKRQIFEKKWTAACK